MMSSPRSAAPESACSPMSNVPPSPANASAVTSFPSASAARLSPAAVAAAVSNGQCTSGTLTGVYGLGPAMIDQQHAGSATCALAPIASSICRMMRAAVHPAHARWPEVRNFDELLPADALCVTGITRGGGSDTPRHCEASDGSVFHPISLKISVSTFAVTGTPPTPTVYP